MKTEVESMVTVPIHQASSSVPLLSTPVINLTPPKHVSSTIQEPFFTTTTETTTTTLPPPPLLQQQSSTDPELSNRVSALEKYINKNVKEVVQDALQAPVHERFRELSEFEMKEILYDKMFKSGSYRSLPEHTALYEALEASMKRKKWEEFMDVTAKSRKRRHNDQDPPPPPPKGSDQSKKTRHDFDASCSKQTPAQMSSAWKSSDTRDAPSSSLKQKPDSQFE
ncbi:hypothetical protein Tco_1291182 [Tanacetum coccineum]